MPVFDCFRFRVSRSDGLTEFQVASPVCSTAPEEEYSIIGKHVCSVCVTDVRRACVRACAAVSALHAFSLALCYL